MILTEFVCLVLHRNCRRNTIYIFLMHILGYCIKNTGGKCQDENMHMSYNGNAFIEVPNKGLNRSCDWTSRIDRIG